MGAAVSNPDCPRENPRRVYRRVPRASFTGGIRKESIDSAILSSVVPPLTRAIADTIQAVSGATPLLLSHGMDLGLSITTENPAEVGADLVANAVAAFDRFHGNCIVVDFGTALTFTAVAAPAAGSPASTPGELQGVAISPGLTSAVDALARNTSQLPRVPLAAPPRIAGSQHYPLHSVRGGLRLRESRGGTDQAHASGAGRQSGGSGDGRKLAPYRPSSAGESIRGTVADPGGASNHLRPKPEAAEVARGDREQRLDSTLPASPR